MDRLSLLYETVDKDKRKREMVIWCVINVYSQMKDYMETLKWLNELLTTDAENQRVRRNLSRWKRLSDVTAGMVCCLLCLVDAWGYRACEGNKEEVDESRSVQYDCWTLLLFGGRLQWSVIASRCICHIDCRYISAGAIGYFDKVSSDADIHAVAANNKSICELLRCNNQAAIHTVQSNLNAKPFKHIQVGPR